MEKHNKAFRRTLLVEKLIWKNPLMSLFCLPLSAPGLFYNRSRIRANYSETSGEKKARVLISSDPIGEWTDGFLGVKGKIAEFFTERGARVDFKHGAESGDLRSTLEDQTYQSIVLVGHGYRNAWSAIDGLVVTSDVDEWMKGLPRKKGYFIQFTCGDKEGRALGDSVVTDKYKILGFTEEVDPGTRYGYLWGTEHSGIDSLERIGV